MKEENINKCQHCYSQEDIEAMINDNNENDSSNWWLVIFLIFAFSGFDKKTDRETLIEKVSKSDLSQIEKKQIIDILLG